MSNLIPLTRGYSAIVDDEDYEWLSRWKWYALVDKHTVYAAREETVNGNSTCVMMHRRICNTPDGYETDHWDGNGLHNCRANLRVVTKSQNMWNRKPQTNGTSPHKGVGWHKSRQKWRARIRVNGQQFHIGHFNSEKDAAAAYAARAAVEFGEFNYLERAK